MLLHIPIIVPVLQMKELSPPNPHTFNNHVWTIVRQIPHGCVVTYGQLAQMLPPPEGVAPDDYKTYGARWVGTAMAACPEDVPWQRVINAQGKISQRPGAMKQKRLLEDEGVVFVDEKLDLKVYQWHGGDENDDLRQGSLF